MSEINWIDDVPREVYVRKVERILYEFPSLEAAIQNELDGGESLPSLVPVYGDDSPKGSNISKPTENYGIRRADKQLKHRMIKRALSSLKADERRLVEIKYFNTRVVSDLEVYSEMRMKKDAYYDLKGQALRKVANALNII